MSTSMKRYIDITSSIIGNGVGEKDMSGLVFTRSGPIDGYSAQDRFDFNNGAPLAMDLAKVGRFFGIMSDEYEFAKKYFSYVSPSGSSPIQLKFFRIGSGVAGAAAATVTGVGISAASVSSASTFGSQVSNVTGVYDFVYASGGWKKSGQSVDLATYSINVTGTATAGDRISVDFIAESATASAVATGVTAVSVTAATFGSEVSNVQGSYVFEYKTVSSSNVWVLNGESVTLSDYGITITGTAAVGDRIVVMYVPISATPTVYGAGVESASVDEYTFNKKVEASGSHVFTYSTSGEVGWYLSGSIVMLDDYGISTVGNPVSGDVITVVNSLPASATARSSSSALRNLKVVAADFRSKVVSPGAYVFKYVAPAVGTGAWKLGNDTVNLADYGVSYYGTPVNGVKITVEFRESYAMLHAFSDATSSDDNFGSFTFLTPADGESSIYSAALKEVAAYNSSLNYEHLFCVSATPENFQERMSAVSMFTGVNVTVCPETADSKGAWMPMAWLSTIDYSRTNSTSSLMFKSFGAASDVAVYDDDTADVYDAANVNYLAETQTNGKKIVFYQRGVNADGTDTGVFCNEVWMKGTIRGKLVDLILGVEKIPASLSGLAMIQSVVGDVLTTACSNGTILPGKDISSFKNVIYTMSGGDAKAYGDVYVHGYYYKSWISKTDGGEYVANYLVIYSKGDAIRKIVGSHVLA